MENMEKQSHSNESSNHIDNVPSTPNKSVRSDAKELNQAQRQPPSMDSNAGIRAQMENNAMDAPNFFQDTAFPMDIPGLQTASEISFDDTVSSSNNKKTNKKENYNKKTEKSANSHSNNIKTSHTASAFKASETKNSKVSVEGSGNSFYQNLEHQGKAQNIQYHGLPHELNTVSIENIDSQIEPLEVSKPLDSPQIKTSDPIASITDEQKLHIEQSEEGEIFKAKKQASTPKRTLPETKHNAPLAAKKDEYPQELENIKAQTNAEQSQKCEEYKANQCKDLAHDNASMCKIKKLETLSNVLDLKSERANRHNSNERNTVSNNAVTLPNKKLQEQSNSSESTQPSTTNSSTLISNPDHEKAITAVGLPFEALQPNCVLDIFKNCVIQFKGEGDQIAQIVVLSKIHKNPAYLYPIFTGIRYNTASINIDNKHDPRNSTDKICREFCTDCAKIFTLCLSGHKPDTKGLRKAYDKFRKSGVGLCCNTVTEMMARIALTNTAAGTKHDDTSGTVDYLRSTGGSEKNGKGKSNYRYPDEEIIQQYSDDFDNAEIGDVVVYYDRVKYDKGEYHFKHIEIIIDCKETKGNKAFAFMGASSLHDVVIPKNAKKEDIPEPIGGVCPRTDHGGMNDPNMRNSWGYVHTKEQLNAIYSPSIKLVYTTAHELKTGHKPNDKNNKKISNRKAFLWKTHRVPQEDGLSEQMNVAGQMKSQPRTAPIETTQHTTPPSAPTTKPILSVTDAPKDAISTPKENTSSTTVDTQNSTISAEEMRTNKDSKQTTNQHESVDSVVDDLSAWYAETYKLEDIQVILEKVGSTQTEINQTSIEEIKAWQKNTGLTDDGKFGKKCCRKANLNLHGKSKAKIKKSRKPTREKDLSELRKWYEETYEDKDIKTILENVGSTQTEINQTSIEEIKAWQKNNKLTPDGEFGKFSCRKAKLQIVSLGTKKFIKDFEYKELFSNSNQTTEYASLSIDKTMRILNTEVFQKDVDKFLSFHGKDESSRKNMPNIQSKVLPFNYLVELVEHGNFGLINLLIGVANYGVDTNPKHGFPSELLKEDPAFRVGFIKEEKNAWKPFNRGKNPFDCKKGGVGIAHYDVGNLHEIYKTYGIPKEYWPESDSNASVNSNATVNSNAAVNSNESAILNIMSDCLYENSKSVSMDIRNNVAYPVNEATPKVFDTVKNDSRMNWTGYMESIVQKTDFQNNAFKKWMEKYWNNSQTALKKNEHATLADANLSSRSKNSSGYSLETGSFQERAESYLDIKGSVHAEHHLRQLVAVQRVNVLEQYILSHPELLKNNKQAP